MSKTVSVYAVKVYKYGMRWGFLDTDLNVCDDRIEFGDKRWCRALVDKAERKYPSSYSFEVVCCGALR